MEIDKKHIWDYDPKTIDLTNPAVLRWYLTRKIESGDWKSLDSRLLKKHLNFLSIDPTLKQMLKKYYAQKRTKSCA